jgi:hypothetical protein
MATLDELIVGLKPITFVLTILIMLYLLIKKGSMTRGRGASIVWWILFIFLLLVTITLGYDLFFTTGT